MTEKLIEALSKLGVLDSKSQHAWESVVVVRNYAPVPPLPGAPPFGFKFFVLGRDGNPAWFGRCGWATSDAMAAECALLGALGNDELAMQHTSESRALLDGPTTIQVSRSLGRTGYNRHLLGRSPAQWVRDCDEVLRLSEAIMARLFEKNRDLFSRNPREQRQRQIVSDLELLVSRGFPEDLARELAHAFEQREEVLPPVLQHGDLWPANILYSNSRWYLIDFTECGMVWTPGYDLMLLLSNGPDGFKTDWIGGLETREGSPWLDARAAVLAAFMKRHAIDESLMGELLLRALVRITAYRMRPGLPSHLSAHWASELKRTVAEWSVHREFSRIVSI